MTRPNLPGPIEKLLHAATPEWFQRAACRDLGPELFYPTPRTKPSELRAAKQVCAECPVSEECLDYALDNREERGIWGGVSPESRKGRYWVGGTR